MTIRQINLNDPQEQPTFSSCVIAGDTIYTSHIAGFLDDAGQNVEGIAAQTRQCFLVLSRTLEAAGASLQDIVKMTVYLRVIDDFEEMRDTYNKLFDRGRPAHMTVTSQFIDPRCRIMIEAIAYKPQG